MAAKQETKLEGKAILMIAVVVLLVALAAWQIFNSMSPTQTDVSFKTKVEAPPDSARPAGAPDPGGTRSDKQ